MMKDTKKIYLEITPFFPTKDSFRGPYVYDQVKALHRTGKFSKIVVLRPGSIFNKEKSYEYNGIRVHYFPWVESPSYLLNGIFDSINKFWFKYWWKKMGIAASDIQVAHAHVSTFAIIPMVLKEMNPKITTIVQHHDLDPYTIRNGKWADKFWNLYYRARRNQSVFGLLDHHVCVSEKVKESLLAFPKARQGECYDSYLSKIEKLKSWKHKAVIKDAIVLYNGVDTRKFYPTAREDSGMFKIGCIANFVELKGHITLLKAFRILVKEKGITDMHLSLIGSGPLLDTCNTYIREHQLEPFIEIKKEVQHDELCRYYNTLDLFVLPSFFEGMGCVFTEAAACGVPFMTCENQGVEDYIPATERSKWLFPVNDHKRLAQLIEQYKTNPQKQELALPWNIDELVDEYLKKIGV